MTNSLPVTRNAVCKVRLALFTPAEGQADQPRVVRVHRLVQELVRRELEGVGSLFRPTTEPTETASTEKDSRPPHAPLAELQQSIDQLIRRRAAALEQTTRWQEARWEIEPLAALANLWADTTHPDAAWLLNQAGQRCHDLADYTRAEPLMRRSLEIFETSLRLDHPNPKTVRENYDALRAASGDRFCYNQGKTKPTCFLRRMR